ncbi:hypothetical protein [Corynebacterium pacaense]|uniref:hypothetical protein n=1 Tax=Corynebacterium pacaense TaxID=1816684 RepID=UPI0009BC22CA|nr:hypothetical protein [Corynebacterium pacaense]
MALDEGLRCGHFGLDSLMEGVGAMRGTTGVEKIRSAAELATPWSESPRESSLKVKLRRAGLPSPYQQVDLFDGRGRFVGRADFYFPEARLAVEYDGVTKTRGNFGVEPEAAALAEMRRARALLNAGHHLRRVDRHNYGNGEGVASIVAVYRELVGGIAPAGRTLWVVRGGPAWVGLRH